MTVSFQTTKFNSTSNFKKNSNAKSISFGVKPTPESIAKLKRIDRDNKICMAIGTVAGVATGCFKYSNKLKAGIIGGVLGLVAGRIVGFFIHPNIPSP